MVDIRGKVENLSTAKLWPQKYFFKSILFSHIFANAAKGSFEILTQATLISL